MSVDTLLWILAVLCWGVAAVVSFAKRAVGVNFIALGLVFAGLTHLIGG